MKQKKEADNYSNEVTNYQVTSLEHTRVNSPHIKYIPANDMFLGSSSMKKIDEHVSQNVQIQD